MIMFYLEVLVVHFPVWNDLSSEAVADESAMRTKPMSF
jgi:hypothetical protein